MKKAIGFSTVAALTLVAISAPQSKGTLPLAQEEVPASEAAAIQTTLELIESLVRKDAAETSSAKRDAHAKAHGCVQAEFEVDADLHKIWSEGSSNEESPTPLGFATRMGRGAHKTIRWAMVVAWRSSSWAWKARSSARPRSRRR